MAIRVECGNCGRELKAREDAAGKKARCPDCGNIVPIPYSGEEPANDEWDAMASEDESFRQTPAQPSQASPHTIDCPSCGETIRAKAKQCRFCGEVLANRGYGDVDDGFANYDAVMTTGDWLVVTCTPACCCLIALIVSLVYCIQEKPKGPKMLGFSFLSIVCWFLLGWIFSLIAQAVS